MTVIVRFEVILVQDGSQSEDIAQAIDALDGYDISYKLTATDTVIEADDVDKPFEAIQATHDAVDAGRIITSVEVDDHGTEQRAADRVRSVASVLGREPEKEM